MIKDGCTECYVCTLCKSACVCNMHRYRETEEERRGDKVIMKESIAQLSLEKLYFIILIRNTF